MNTPFRIIAACLTQLCVIALSVSATSHTPMKVLQQKKQIAIVKQAAAAISSPARRMAKKTAANTGPYLSYVEIMLLEDGEWTSQGTMTLSYDAQDRISALEQTSTRADESYSVTYYYTYNANGNVITETMEDIDSTAERIYKNRSERTYYFNGKTTPIIFSEYLSEYMFHPDIFRLDKTEMRAIDSILIREYNWDATSQSWMPDGMEMSAFYFNGKSISVATAEFNAETALIVKSVEKFDLVYNLNGKIDSIYCYQKDEIASPDFILQYIVTNTFDPSGRLATITQRPVEDDQEFYWYEEIGIEYDANGLPGAYQINEVVTYDSETKTETARMIFHYADSPNMPVTQPNRSIHKRSFSAASYQGGVTISIPQGTRVKSVTILDLAGRELTRFESFSRHQHEFRIPVQLNGAISLLRVETDRSVEILRLNGAMPKIR